MKFPLSLAAAAARWMPAWLKKAVYRSGPLARLIRRTLNRAAPTGLSVVTVAAGGLQGATLELNLQTEKDYWLGTYEPELQRALRDWVRPGQVVYDVGANIGYVSLLLARAAGSQGKVYAFEPLPANLERLRKNVELNSSQLSALSRQPEAGSNQPSVFSDQPEAVEAVAASPENSQFAIRNSKSPIIVIPSAITDSPGKVRFLAHSSGAMGKAAGSAGRQDQDYPVELEVDALSLDSFAFEGDNPPPQVVKMDIEGGEVLALPGMRRLLAQARPLLLLELHGPDSARAAWQELTQAGYTLRRMETGYPPIPSLEELGWKAYIVATPI